MDCWGIMGLVEVPEIGLSGVAGAFFGWAGGLGEFSVEFYQALIYWGKIGLLLAFVLAVIAFAVYLIAN